jgi:hypothetical protein
MKKIGRLVPIFFPRQEIGQHFVFSGTLPETPRRL